MGQGGLYDHVAGGFHRYSTDRRWLVPHFEKMLYDNAQLVPVYLDMFTLTHERFYRHIVEETLDYVAREMTNAKGGFYSATDADSTVPGKAHQEEGWYFTWSLEEFRKTIDSPTRQMLEAYFRVTQRGDFEGRNILHVRTDAKDFVQKYQIDTDEFFQLLTRAKSQLYNARTLRIAPLRDEKVIASWNGLMISALLKQALHSRMTVIWQRHERLDITFCQR